MQFVVHPHNIYKFVNQLEIVGTEKRIPDGIIYINGLPIVVFEFKSAIREEATIHNAFELATNEIFLNCLNTMLFV
jgi:type I restriction enzyme R subunit